MYLHETQEKKGITIAPTFLQGQRHGITPKGRGIRGAMVHSKETKGANGVEENRGRN